MENLRPFLATRTATSTATTVAAAAMLAVSAVAMSVAGGMMAVAGGYMTPPGLTVWQAIVTGRSDNQFVCSDFPRKPFGTYLPSKDRGRKLALRLNDATQVARKSLVKLRRLSGENMEREHQQLKYILEKRKEAFVELLDNDPAQAIPSLLTPDEVSSLEAFSNRCVAKKMRRQGSLEVRHADYFDQGFSINDYRLKTTDGRTLSLRPVSEPRSELLSGMEVDLEGFEVGDTMLVDFNQEPDQPKGEIGGLRILKKTSNPPVLGDQKTIVVMVNFSNSAQPSMTAEQAREVMDEVRGYYRENSYGQATLRGVTDPQASADVFGWYQIPLDETCDREAVEAAAIKAVDPDVNFNNYSRLIVIAPINNNDPKTCGWAGISGMDKTSVLTSDGVVWMSVATIKVRWSNLFTIAHELGHGFGNRHANFYDCGSGLPGAGASACEEREYYDPYDVMGFFYTGHYNAIHKEQTGWLRPSNIVTISGDGQYPIEPIESDTLGVKALKIPRTARGNYLYVEYRQPLGFDSKLTGPDDRTGETHASDVFQGALLHTQGSLGPNLIDPTPPAWYFTSALTAGQLYRDALTGTTIRVISQTPEVLTVEIKNWNVVTENFSPVISIVSPQDGQKGSGVITVSADARDADGIDRVEFYNEYVGDRPDATDFSEPYEFTLDTTHVPNATVYGGYSGFTVYAVAFDTTGLSSQRSVTLAIENIDPSPPTNVAITSPSNNTSWGGRMPVSAAANDDVGIWMMRYYIDQGISPYGNDYYVQNGLSGAAPYAVDLPLGWLPPGPHILRAVAYDFVGNTAESPGINFTIEEGPPLIKFFEPLDGEVFTDGISPTFLIRAGVRSDLGADSITLFRDDHTISTFEPWEDPHYTPYSIVAIGTYSATKFSEGPHTLRAVAKNFPYSAATQITIEIRKPTFRRGDANGSGRVDISDAVFTLTALFVDTSTPIPCDDAADSNDDGRVDISDPITALNYLFLGTGDIVAPGVATPGPDPTGDELGCAEYVAP